MHKLNIFVVDAPTNIKTEVHATTCFIQWDLQRYVREYQITYSETTRNSIKLVKVDGSEDNVSNKRFYFGNLSVPQYQQNCL